MGKKRLISAAVAALLIGAGAWAAYAGYLKADDASAPVLPAKALAHMVKVPGGVATIGADNGLPRERPIFKTQVQTFFLDRTLVTVADFAAFTKRTRYVTENERLGSGAVMSMKTGEWSLVEGATWRRPFGPKGREAKADHPVTQVSWNDAKAYCERQGKRLPSEVEWEYAARFGQEDAARFPFKGEVENKHGYQANVWTGVFPVMNTEQDGYLYTSPVRAFPPSQLGLYDMSGNVWEWVADWYLPYSQRGKEFKASAQSKKVQRGGSFLCDPNFCYGFRVTAREGATPDSAFIHVGFRCAVDAEQGQKRASREGRRNFM